MIGWEAGIRTPIRRSRVCSPTVRRPPRVNNLRQRSGTTCIKPVSFSTAGGATPMTPAVGIHSQASIAIRKPTTQTKFNIRAVPRRAKNQPGRQLVPAFSVAVPVSLGPLRGLGSGRIQESKRRFCCEAGALLGGADCGVPKILSGDKGSEYFSQVMDLWAHQNGARTAFSSPGKPPDSAHAEPFNGAFHQKGLNARRFMTPSEAKAIIEAWRREYNENRPRPGSRGEDTEPIRL